jgi:hypothetical protein
MRGFVFRIDSLYFCKIFARWVYKNKRTPWHHDALLVVRSMRLYLGKIFARWVYKNTNARNDMTMCGFVFRIDSLYFVKYLQDGLTKIQTHAIRARNPRFYFVHAGTKPRFLTKKRHQKSGIQCSACNDITIRCLLSARCVCILVKYLQDGP